MVTQNDNSARRVRLRRQHLRTGIPDMSLPGLCYDGEKLICGLCGKRYKKLAVHILRTHGWDLDDYRIEFSLNRTQPLVTPQLSDKYAEVLKARGLAGVVNLLSGGGRLKGQHYQHRRQAKQTMSHEHAKPIRIDPVILQNRQSKNGQRAHLIVSCAICGGPTPGMNTHKRQFFCSSCWKKHEKLYLAEWRNNHRDSIHAAQKKYREKVKEAEVTGHTPDH